MPPKAKPERRKKPRMVNVPVRGFGAPGADRNRFWVFAEATTHSAVDRTRTIIKDVAVPQLPIKSAFPRIVRT